MEGFHEADQVSDDEILITSGIWKDGLLLVISLEESYFPLRCVLTNAPVSSLTHYSIIWNATSPSLWLPKCCTQPGLWTKSADVKIGLDPTTGQWRKRCITIGWTMVIGGVISFLLGVVGLVFQVINALGPMLYVVLCMPLVAVLGVRLLMIAYFPSLIVRRWWEGHIWIEGVHPEFLKELPKWNDEEDIW